jgi:hypothetical protein
MHSMALVSRYVHAPSAMPSRVPLQNVTNRHGKSARLAPGFAARNCNTIGNDDQPHHTSQPE